MAKITLDTVVSGFKAVANLLSNFTKIETELNSKVLYRDNPSGEPNQMENDLDMNGNLIHNVGGIGDGYTLLTQALGDDRYVNIDGDTMTGILDMSGQKITSLGYPVISTDASSVQYVNDKVADAIASFSFELATTGDVLKQIYTISLDGDNTITIPILNPSSIEIFVNGVHQPYNVAYTVSGVTVTFSEGLLAGDTVVALIGNAVVSSDVATLVTELYTATGGETTVSTGAISALNPTELFVFINGVKQASNAYTIDYTNELVDFGTASLLAGDLVDITKVVKIAEEVDMTAPILQMKQTIDVDTAISVGYNALSVDPIISSGVTVTVPSTSKWVIVGD